MQISLVLFTIAKHLNNAALELEDLEKQVLQAKFCDDVVTEPRIENGSQEDSKESSEESCKESSKKSKKSCKESKKSCEVVAEPAQVEVIAEPPAIGTKIINGEKVKVEIPTLTLEIVRAECKKVIDAKGRDALANLLTLFGASKTSDLKEIHYFKVVQACKELLGGKDEF